MNTTNISRTTLLMVLTTFFVASDCIANEEPVIASFNKYKACIKRESAQGESINTNNYMQFCESELTDLKATAGSSYEQLLSLIMQWFEKNSDA